MDKTCDIQSDQIELTLNSFVRRTQNTKQLKALLTSCQGTLSRHGRSRNWTLQLPAEKRRMMINQLYEANEPSWLWLAKKLASQRISLQPSELHKFIKDNPSITINELMEQTNCSAKEARIALDDFEWQG